MKIHVCDQYSPEWWELRRGIPTASNFHRILTPKTGKLSAQADSYICDLIGELYDPEYPRIDRGVNDAMREGTRREPESRRWYCMEADCEVEQVGFVTNDAGTLGFSPDGMVLNSVLDNDGGFCGGLECKNPGHATHVSYLLGERSAPAEYIAQIHGPLAIEPTLEWYDWISYCPPLPALRVRVFRNDYTAKLAEALKVFIERLAEAKAKIAALKAEGQ